MTNIHTITIPWCLRALAFLFMGTLFYHPVLSQTNPVLEAAMERDILVALYDNTNGDEWTRNTNWKLFDFHYCDWHGITCLSLTDSQRRLDEEQQQSIESIDLSDNNLRGSVPISLLLLLPNLHTLKLSGNNIDYTKNAEIEESVLGESINVDVPLSSSIHHLDVSHTTVRSIEQLFSTGSGDGTIQTPQLSTLYMNSAQLRGTFPHALTTLRNLERLSLDHNDLSGTLPNTVGNWLSLKYLSIADNQMTGTIPTTTTQWTKLRYLLLEANRLTGSLPLGLTSSEYTPLLEQLDLSDQRSESTKPSPTAGLSGTIPHFSTQKRLRRLDLGVNSFTGTIPSNLLEATEDLDFVVLSHNLLTGSVPSSVLSRISIDSLLMEDNRIATVNPSDCPSEDSYGCHAILCPPLFYEPRSGRQEEENRPCLECPENTKYWGQTTCMLDEEPAPTAIITPPPASRPSPGMTEPPSAGGQPVGAPSAVPPPTQTGINEYGILLDIFAATGGDEWLDREGWDSPDASSDFCNWFGITCVSPQLRSVESIRLGSNYMNGTLPASIYHLPNLKVVDLSRNPMLTVSFQNIDRATALEALDVSATKVGNLDGLSNARNIRELQMSDIQGLSGVSMPLELFELTTLRQLTLDYNNIAAFLPDDIGNLSHLQVFSATDNDLTGSIPASIAQLSFLTTLRLTSNHLTGTLPVGMASMTGLAVLDLSNQWSNGEDDDFSDNNRAGIRGPLPSFEGFTQLRRLDLAVNSFSGTIPSNFLSGVDRDFIFEYADVSENSLTGKVPAVVAGLHDLHMQDNMLTGIDQLVCDSLPGDITSIRL
jgi:Leucine-rich repeat (LRR) protein